MGECLNDVRVDVLTDKEGGFDQMDDTIELRQLIEAVLRGKWIIAGVTAITMLVTGVVSFFVLEPTYQAQTTLLVSLPQRPQQANGSGLASVLEGLSASPYTSLETLRRQITSAAVLSQVIYRLNLDLTPAELAKKVTAQAPKDTTLLEISVSDSDPELAATIANTLVEVFVAHVDALAKGQIQLASRFLEEQLVAEQAKLEQATAELKAFLQQPRGTAELEQELNAKLNLITEYESQKVQLQVEVDARRAELAEAEELVNTLPPRLTTTRVVADDPVLHQLTGHVTGDPAAAAGLRMESEQLNDAWVEASKLAAVKRVELAKLEAQLATLDDVIASTRKELESLRTELVDKQTVEQQLRYRVELSNDAIRALQQKYHESSISEAAQIAETSVAVVSPALIPTDPVAPRKLMNVAVSAVLGLMVGVGYVLFMDYWRSGAMSPTTSSPP